MLSQHDFVKIWEKKWRRLWMKPFLCSDRSENVFLDVELCNDYEKKLLKKNVFFSCRKFILKTWVLLKIDGFGRVLRWVTPQKIWNLELKLIQKVVQTCPLVLKLCEVAVPTSFTTSENFIKKYLFLVKLSMIFDFTPQYPKYATLWMVLGLPKKKHCYMMVWRKFRIFLEKNLRFFFQNQFLRSPDFF